VLRTRSQGLLPLATLKLGWRRWRFKARLRPPLEELVRHNRLVTHHRFLAAQQQRQDIADRLRVRQDNKLRIARARAEFSAVEARGQDLRGAGLASEPAGQAIEQAAAAGAGRGGGGLASARPDRDRQAASGLPEGENLRGELRSDPDGGAGGPYQRAHRRDRVTHVETAHASADLCFPLAERVGPNLGRLTRGQPEMGNLVASTDKAKAEHQMPPDQAGQAEQPALTSLAPGGKARADGGARACEFGCQFGCGFSSVSQRVSAFSDPHPIPFH
jgi:hypothetical protein